MSNEVLHPIAQKVLTELRTESERGKNDLPFAMLAKATQLSEDQVRRAVEWLRTRGFVEVLESYAQAPTLSLTGASIPELSLVRRLQEHDGTLGLGDLRKAFATDEEFSAAFGRAKSSGWVLTQTKQGRTTVRLVDESGAKKLERVLELLREGAQESAIPPDSRTMVSDLIRRGLAKRAEEKVVAIRITKSGKEASAVAPERAFLDELTPEIIVSGAWRGRPLRPLDVEAPAPRLFPGRRHPVRDFIKEVRETYISMGFTEIQGTSLQPAFWNFDALFIPQDHPGRDMQDTFYVQGIVDRTMKRRGVIQRVAATHENGWRTGSRGWGYSWQVDEARRLVLRTHNTVLTIRSLLDAGEREMRVFAVSKVYRNENLDYKHLAEFHQMDGIIAGKGLNVKHLMGFLTEFYKKLGMREVKLWPSYFPYTEPSLQVMGYSEIAKEWIELGGSGVFRPEVTRPIGVTVPVLAWGPGIERLMLLRYRLDDLRELYYNDLSWLRNRAEYARS